ncbi:FAD-dependent oxidoreductase [Paracoccus beibuensis]|uniref:FAD-dependent oxidoreductase n=1 Tax=Paracoccus beibuensis TaxID=547602 RepID=UPI0022403E5E|nr:FAD-dependent oxidoreductase [Paracoccus beibuensis]
MTLSGAGMEDRLDVAIIGAGITGITCAHDLQAAELRVRLFDKRRGVGGRLAARWTDGGLRFDHGATPAAPPPRFPDPAGGSARRGPDGGVGRDCGRADRCTVDVAAAARAVA